MRLVIAAPANGAILKDALKVHLQNDPRVSSLIDLSSPEGTYPQLSFAAAEEVAAGRRRHMIYSPSAARWRTITRKFYVWGKT